MIGLGLLGAARITPKAIIGPAADCDGLEVHTIAARDRRRAEAFAAGHGIGSFGDDYAELVARTDVEAVYIALPASHHHRWALAAIAAGKHVLCEKPLASNGAQAAELVAAADAAGVVLMEAFHYRYHPFTDRWLDLAERLGPISLVEGRFEAPIAGGDIRWDPELAGGALMDLGCYPLHAARSLLGELTVVRARAVTDDGEVDATIDAELAGAAGATVRLRTSMRHGPAVDLRVRGERGELVVENWITPRLRGGRLTAGAETEEADTTSSYLHQLRAFVAAVESGVAPVTAGADAVANMTTIDAIYRAAGLSPRR